MLMWGLPFMACHFVGAQYLREHRSQHLAAFYFLIGSVWITWLIGTKGFLFLLIQPLILFGIKLLTGSDKLIYMAALSYKILENARLMVALKQAALDTTDYSQEIGHITESWINLRAMSCCLDLIWQEVPSSGNWSDFVKMLAHSFYMPVLVLGPVIRFKEFNDGLEAKSAPWNMSRVTTFTALLLRFSFWWLVAQLWRLLYMTAIRYDVDVADSMWTVCGTAYIIGQNFNLRYVVFYGLPRAFYFADGIEDIPTPRCICRISHYSNMWKHFDVGLYRVIQKYFYFPLMTFRLPGTLVKLFASFLTFCFVYIWHGQHQYVLV